MATPGRRARLLLVLAALGLAALAPQVKRLRNPTPHADTDAIADAAVPAAGPDRERWFFSDWHGDAFDAVLPDDVFQRMRADVERVPVETDRAAVGWTLVGPAGMETDNGELYSGRILDIDWDWLSGPHGQIWLAAASGGLWRYDDTPPYASIPLTESLPTQVVGTVSVDPANPLNIVIGTGEYGVRNGSGIYRTTDGGVTWAAAAFNPATGIPHRIRHVDSSLLIGTTSQAMIRSTDGGASWTTTVQGGIYFDLALDPSTPGKAFATYSNNMQTAQVVRTFDGGQTWFLVGPAVLNAVRGAVAVAWSDPDVVYAAFSAPSGAAVSFRGAYKSTDGGSSWTSVLAAGDGYMGAGGWYNNVVDVFPYDEDDVRLLGVNIKRSNDGGTSWYDEQAIDANGLHPDFHAASWVAFYQGPVPPLSFGGVPAPRGVFAPAFLGHDGGWSWSDNFGNTWNTDRNLLPITQYTHIHSAENSLQTVGGGSQDNGISLTTDAGATWRHRQPGDGSTLSIDPNDVSRMWSVVGVYPNPILFRRHRSTDGGITWAQIDAGIAPDNTWYTELHNDRVDPVWLYTNTGTQAYESTDSGSSWTSIGSFASMIRSLRVGTFSAPSPAVWVVLNIPGPGDRVHVYDGATWTPCDAGLPPGLTIRSVIPHPVEPNTAFALVNGIGTPGEKVYRTTDRGSSWTNVSGDLPDVPLGGIVAHPTDPTLLYLGTEMGCFRGVDAGGWIWLGWNQGMPSAPIVSDMTWVDMLDSTGEFWILAGTYGRSIYRREVMDVEVAAPEVTLVPGMSLEGGAPNPVRATGVSHVSFSLPKAGTVRLAVYDVAGREVATLLDGPVAAGRHEVPFRPTAIAPGVYFCRLQAGSKVLSRKLTVVR